MPDEHPDSPVKPMREVSTDCFCQILTVSSSGSAGAAVDFGNSGSCPRAVAFVFAKLTARRVPPM
jgi:hypothetical protein